VNSSGVISSNGAKTVTIASFTHTSMGPNSSSTRRAAVSTWSARATSVGMASALPPAASTALAAASRDNDPIRKRVAALAHVGSAAPIVIS